MLRVIIADDEERICKLIRILADWERLGMEVVGTAGNGVEALRQIEELRPDILITDIRMPGMDGLTLISRAKEAVPALEVIIISGYAQFDYAQTAIQYGVGDYLLKPINQEALNHTLEKMRDRCLTRLDAESDRERQRLDSEDDRERLRAGLLTDLLGGAFTARDAAQLRRDYYFTGQADTWQICLLKLDYDPAEFVGESLTIVCDKARDVLCPVLLESCDDFLLECRGPTLYGVLNYEGAEQGAMRQRLRACLNQLVEGQSLFGNVIFSMALGRAMHTVGGLADSFAGARLSLAERLTEGTGRLLEGEITPSALPEMNLLAGYAQRTAQAIDVLSAPEADAALEELERRAMAVPHVHGGELLELCQGAALLFITRLGADNREQMMEDFSFRTGQCYRPEQVFACLGELQRQLLESALEKRRHQDDQPIRLAKQYIQKHFAGPITLEEVSASIGFSVNYFSTLFKKETGEGFARYLTRVRMEEAKRLLRETRLSVADICARVGYGDIKHFTRTFRGENGITPGEFRKLYG